jgi:hypothetical protein
VSSRCRMVLFHAINVSISIAISRTDSLSHVIGVILILWPKIAITYHFMCLLVASALLSYAKR